MEAMSPASGLSRTGRNRARSIAIPRTPTKTSPIITARKNGNSRSAYTNTTQ